MKMQTNRNDQMTEEMSEKHQRRLRVQLRKLVQLLAQNWVLASEWPNDEALRRLASRSKDMLTDLHCSGLSIVGQTLNLPDAFDMVEQPLGQHITEPWKTANAKFAQKCLPNSLALSSMHLLLTSRVFSSPNLLPRFAASMAKKTPLSQCKVRQKNDYFGPADDWLLTMGLRKYGGRKDKYDAIQRHLLPDRSTVSIKARASNMMRRAKLDNPIQIYSDSSRPLPSRLRFSQNSDDSGDALIAPIALPGTAQPKWAKLYYEAIASFDGNGKQAFHPFDRVLPVDVSSQVCCATPAISSPGESPLLPNDNIDFIGSVTCPALGPSGPSSAVVDHPAMDFTVDIDALLREIGIGKMESDVKEKRENMGKENIAVHANAGGVEFARGNAAKLGKIELAEINTAPTKVPSHMDPLWTFPDESTKSLLQTSSKSLTESVLSTNNHAVSNLAAPLLVDASAPLLVNASAPLLVGASAQPLSNASAPLPEFPKPGLRHMPLFQFNVSPVKSDVFPPQLPAKPLHSFAGRSTRIAAARSDLSPAKQRSPTKRPKFHSKMLGNSPKKLRTILQTSGTIPQKSGTIPQKSGTIPHKSGIVPQKSGIVPQKSGIVPQKSGIIPQKLVGSQLGRTFCYSFGDRSSFIAPSTGSLAVGPIICSTEKVDEPKPNLDFAAENMPEPQNVDSSCPFIEGSFCLSDDLKPISPGKLQELAIGSTLLSNPIVPEAVSRSGCSVDLDCLPLLSTQHSVSEDVTSQETPLFNSMVLNVSEGHSGYGDGISASAVLRDWDPMPLQSKLSSQSSQSCKQNERAVDGDGKGVSALGSHVWCREEDAQLLRIKLENPHLELDALINLLTLKLDIPPKLVKTRHDYLSTLLAEYEEEIAMAELLCEEEAQEDASEANCLKESLADLSSSQHAESGCGDVTTCRRSGEDIDQDVLAEQPERPEMAGKCLPGGKPSAFVMLSLMAGKTSDTEAKSEEEEEETKSEGEDDGEEAKPKEKREALPCKRKRESGGDGNCQSFKVGKVTHTANQSSQFGDEAERQAACSSSTALPLHDCDPPAGPPVPTMTTMMPIAVAKQSDLISGRKKRRIVPQLLERTRRDC